MDFLTRLLSSDFMPHGHCFMWEPDILWLRVGSDAVVAGSYFAIPFVLIYFLRRRRDMVFPSIFVLFGLFIGLCGLTHVLGIYTVWVPVYRLESVVKALTAVFSLATVVALVRLLPVALKLPSSTQMRRELEERQRVEMELAALQIEERSRMEQDRFFKLSLNMICIVNMEGRFQRINPAWHKILGYTEEELMASSFIEFLHPDDHKPSMEEFKKVLAGEERRAFENRYRCKDGTYRWFMWNAVIQRDSNEIYATAQDITDIKSFTDELVQAKEQAEAANHTKSAFLATMSHELRTPLNAIIGFSEILEDQTFGPLNKRQERYVGSVLTSSRHLLALINGILDLSKIETGKMDLQFAPLDLGSALGDIKAMMQSLAEKKSIGLDFDLALDLPPIEADAGKFKQIMYNLLSNAIKFTPEGGRVGVRARQCDAGLEIAISDTGIGIRAEDLERIFNSFEQVDSSYARQQEGTGLGLTLTRRLIELHEGCITVESPGLGQGTTFTFVLPVTHGAPVSAGNGNNAPTAVANGQESSEYV